MDEINELMRGKYRNKLIYLYKIEILFNTNIKI